MSFETLRNRIIRTQKYIDAPQEETDTLLASFTKDQLDSKLPQLEAMPIAGMNDEQLEGELRFRIGKYGFVSSQTNEILSKHRQDIAGTNGIVKYTQPQWLSVLVPAFEDAKVPNTDDMLELWDAANEKVKKAVKLNSLKNLMITLVACLVDNESLTSIKHTSAQATRPKTDNNYFSPLPEENEIKWPTRESYSTFSHRDIGLLKFTFEKQYFELLDTEELTTSCLGSKELAWSDLPAILSQAKDQTVQIKEKMHKRLLRQAKQKVRVVRSLMGQMLHVLRGRKSDTYLINP